MSGRVPKVLVVGTGSVGRRHIANLLALNADITAYSYRRDPNPELRALSDRIRIVTRLEDARTLPIDAVVVANTTDRHIDVALDSARLNRHLFIEKPLSNSLQGVQELARVVSDHGLAVETGFMLRLHPNVRFIKEFLESGALGTVSFLRAVVGQHLPNWRPGVNYRDSYSAKRSQGGGVILDLVHELDLVRWLLGDVEDVAAMVSRCESLEIETEAVAQIVMRLQSGVLAQVHLDYVRPGYARALEIVGTQGTLFWDYVGGTVSLTGDDGVPARVHQVPDGFERNDMFKRHMEKFVLQVLTGMRDPVSSMEDGIQALRIALACHRSAPERRFVRPDEMDEKFSIPEHRP
jgi:predicted dehydrogenase